jgi:ketosteroid isomerase-like protein
MRLTVLLTALSCAVVACQPAPPENVSDADVARLRALAGEFARAAMARSDSANAAQYTENAVFMPPNQPAVEGRAAIQAWFKASPPMAAFRLTVIEVDGHGDVAYTRGRYALTIAAAGKTPAVSDHGKFLAVHRRQANGSWLMTDDIFNSDVPLPAGR